MDLETLETFVSNTYGDAPYGLEDMVVLRSLSFAVAVPANASSALKRYVLAAAQTHYLRNVSVDHVLKRYSTDWDFSDGESGRAAVVSRACQEAKLATRESLARLHRFHKPSHAGLVASWAALFRLQATVRACVFTVRSAFHFESACLLRVFVEQLAWIATIYDEDDFDRVFAIEPRRSLGILRRLFQRAGFVYGHLSERAHISPERTTDYVTADESGTLFAAITDRDRARLDALLLLILADWYIVLCEMAAANHRHPDERILVGRSHSWTPNPSRPFLSVVNKLEAELFPSADE